MTDMVYNNYFQVVMTGMVCSLILSWQIWYTMLYSSCHDGYGIQCCIQFVMTDMVYNVVFRLSWQVGMVCSLILSWHIWYTMLYASCHDIYGITLILAWHMWYIMLYSSCYDRYDVQPDIGMIDMVYKVIFKLS